MAFITRYQQIKKGKLILTGNSMMLYQPANTSAGPFTSTNTSLQDGTSPAGTTRNWRLNSAMAVLTLPAGSTVAYAELSWTSLITGTGFDVSANKDDPVTFVTPAGRTTVAPQVTDGTAIYTRSANVTSLVQAGGSGQYTVGGIAGLTGYEVAANGIGWFLSVVVLSSTEQYRLFQINVGSQSVPGAGTLDFTLSNFQTPSTGTVSGKLFMGVQRGDPGVDFVTIFVGPTTASLTQQLTRAPLPNNNMMIGIISNADTGTLIDTSGTFGTRNNQTSPPAAVSNARFHIDIASFDITPSLTNNQTTLATRSTSTTANSTFIYNIYDLQVEVQSANLTPIVKNVDQTYAKVGDTLTYTITFTNAGQVESFNTILTDTVPTGTTFAPGTVYINGVQKPAENPQLGINIGTVAAGQAISVTFQVVVNTIPNPNPIPNKADIGFDFISLSTQPPIHDNQQSNTVNTTISQETFSSTKIVDKAYANVGDTISYSIVLKNLGNITASNIVFLDTIPNGTSLISGTFLQDSTPVTGSPNTPGATLPNSIVAGGTSTVTFKVRVTTIPNPNPIINTASTRYSYTMDPSVPNGQSGTTQTNQVTTQVNNANLGTISKRVDKAFAKVGDTLLYTIVIPNTGSTTATNVKLFDTIPNNTSFVANTIFVNAVQRTGEVIAPPTGLTVGTIPNNSVTTVTFVVLINTIPSPNPIPNTATTTYSYIVDPCLGTTATGSGNTNQVTTRVNTAIIGTTKSTSISNGFVGDTVLYTMVLRNSGNTTATNIVLFDTIPNATTFIIDSVTVNNGSRSGINPQTNGVTIPDLAVGGVATVQFSVVINTIPNPNPTTNSSTTSYSYLLDSSTPSNATGNSNSNVVDTYVNPNTNPLKIVNQGQGTIGTTLTYTIVWRNVTNQTQTNVIFVDTLPNGVTFVPNTLNVNGVTIAGGTITPPNGVNTGTLPANSLTTVTYQVVVNTIPTPNPIPNTASVTNTGVGGTQTFESNQVDTAINYAQLGIVSKAVDKGYASINETVAYTIVLRNTGNTTANNVVVTDTIPSGTTFEINTVMVDGQQQPGAVVVPPTGLTLSSIPAGQTTTIIFQVRVVSIPNPNRALNSANVTNTFVVDPIIGTTQTQNNNTNITVTTIIDATIVPVKAVSKTYANVGDTLVYTVTIAANGNTTANNVVFTDSLPSTVTYVPGTFAINGVTLAGGSPLSQSIGSLTVPAIYTITFNAVVNTVPNPNPIQNTATTTFTFTVVPTLPNDRSRTGTSNTVATNVNTASLGGIVKRVDKAYADCGETITYTLDIPNSGNVTATNVIFRDTIPNGTTLVPDSVYVNGVQQVGASPATGVTIGTIAPGVTASVTFSVIVQC